MAPESDAQVISLGPCNVCGQEQLKRRVLITNLPLKIEYETRISCACGERVVADT